MIGGCPNANCHISGPSWSPDGRSIADIGGGRLYITDVASRAIRAVPRRAASLPVFWARWTDEGHITFVGTKAGSHAYAVWTVGIDGSGAEVIAELR